MSRTHKKKRVGEQMSLPAWAHNVSLSGRVAAAVVGTLYLLQLLAPSVRSVFALVPARCVCFDGDGKDWRTVARVVCGPRRQNRRMLRGTRITLGRAGAGVGLAPRPHAPSFDLDHPHKRVLSHLSIHKHSHRVVPCVWQLLTASALETALVKVRVWGVGVGAPSQTPAASPVCPIFRNRSSSPHPPTQAVLNICGLVLAAQVLEPVWGVRELASYTALASVATTGATLVAAYVSYVLNVYAKDAGKIM